MNFDNAAIVFSQLYKIGNTKVFSVVNEQGYQNLLSKVSKQKNEIIEQYENKHKINDLISRNKETKVVLEAIEYLISIDNSVVQEDYINDERICSALNSNIEIGFLFLSFSRIGHFIQHKENISTLFQNIFFIKQINDFPIEVVHYVYSANKVNEKARIIYLPLKKCYSSFNDFGDKVVYNERQLNCSESNDYVKKIKYCVDKYCSPNENICFFGPEIEGGSEIDVAIKEVLNGKQYGFFCCPSKHKTAYSTTKNEACIFARVDHKTKTHVYSKSVPALSKTKFEKIECTEHHILIFSIANFGRLMFIICREALSDDYFHYIEQVNPDVIVIQSYTEKYSEFLKIMNQLAFQKRICILGNSCFCTWEKNLGKPCFAIQLCHTLNNTKEIGRTCTNLCKDANSCFFEINLSKEVIQKGESKLPQTMIKCAIRREKYEQ